MEYVEVKWLQSNPTLSNVLVLAELSADMGIDCYGRQDARNFVKLLTDRGMRTTFIRRRLSCLSAVLNYAYAEYKLAGRKPFSRVMIAGEDSDRVRRHPIPTETLRDLYEACLATDRPLRWAIPIIGKTRCRIAEIIGVRRLKVGSDCLSIRIVAHGQLKTSGSERTLPLVGYARLAMERLIDNGSDDYLFPTYLRVGQILATHAGNTLNEWLKQKTAGRTAHSLRHAFRDHLSAVECPIDLLDALGGWSVVQDTGRRYGTGYTMEQKRHWLEKITLDFIPMPSAE